MQHLCRLTPQVCNYNGPSQGSLMSEVICKHFMRTYPASVVSSLKICEQLIWLLLKYGASQGSLVSEVMQTLTNL